MVMIQKEKKTQVKLNNELMYLLTAFNIFDAKMPRNVSNVSDYAKVKPSFHSSSFLSAYNYGRRI